MDNSCLITRVDDGSEIGVLSLGISGDMGSSSRRFTGTVSYTDLDKIRTNNGPVDINILANGINWRAVITGYSDNRQSGQDSASFSATSRSIALAKPYALQHTGINADAASAYQLALGLLDYTGWTLGWHLYLDPLSTELTALDWIIPAGGFSLLNATPIEGIKMLADAVGAFVQCDMVNQVVHVRPRYPVAPWKLSQAQPDVILPVDAATVVAGQWVEQQLFNGVWVSGQSVGACALIRRYGTAGDVQAPMIVDALLTEQQANTARGIKILADSGSRQPVSITLGIHQQTGVIEPGQIVQINDSNDVWKGICLSSSVTIVWQDDGLVVKQTPVIERWYG